MKRIQNLLTEATGVLHLSKLLLLILPVGILAGSASALFLWSLDRVTEFRWQHEWLLFLLPIAGLLIGYLYHWVGKSAERGSNLIFEQIHEPGGGVPTRMAPLVLLGTLITHLFGGSAGREGTAVQMGGSLASAYGRFCRMNAEHTRMLLMAGVAAGFASVFGTPLTGAIFAMEVLVIGRIQYDAVIPILAASVVGDATCSFWGIQHTAYHIHFADTGSLHAVIDGVLLAKVVLVAAIFGLTSRFFAESIHGLQQVAKTSITFAPLRPVIGGVIVIGLVYLCGTRDYLGLGVRPSHEGAITLLSSFTAGGTTTWSWLWKLVFTVVTLASGFKGGEVTPLFFIGAALGNSLGLLLGAPVELFAGLGFIGVFAGATNTPLACTIMGIELFGSHYVVYFAVACFVAYYFSGPSGIYRAQRVGVPKSREPAGPTQTAKPLEK